jgi:hypothetical protein
MKVIETVRGRGRTIPAREEGTVIETMATEKPMMAGEIP